MKAPYMQTQVKEGRNWVMRHDNDHPETVIRKLATELAAKYIGKSSYIKSIRRVNNHDGTQTYTVTYYDSVSGRSDVRSVYIVDIY